VPSLPAKAATDQSPLWAPGAEGGCWVLERPYRKSLARFLRSAPSACPWTDHERSETAGRAALWSWVLWHARRQVPDFQGLGGDPLAGWLGR